MTMIRLCGLLVLTLSFMTGCAVDHPSPQDVKAFIPDRSTEVIAGGTERATVRSVLGTPHLSSAYWRFDLFRVDTEQTDILFAMTPWPIPFARLKGQLQRDTLVACDAKGLPTTGKSLCLTDQNPTRRSSRLACSG